MENKKYKVLVEVEHKDKVLAVGEEVELTDAEAKELGDKVEVVEEEDNDK